MEEAENAELETGQNEETELEEGAGGTVDRWEREENEMETGGADGEEGMGEEVNNGDEDATNYEHDMEDNMDVAPLPPQEVDEEVKKLVEEGNMEQLANLVLNGEGHRLMGQTSDDPELQGFLNNVPAYMVSNKISQN